MLFNPTPLEKLSSLADEVVAKFNRAHEELEVMREEMVSTRAYGGAQDEEIERLNELIRQKDAELQAKTVELSEKDAEIEAIIAKIESMLG